MIFYEDKPMAKGRLRWGLLLFCIAAAIRLVFILQYSDSPDFNVPTIDSASYDRIARLLAEEGRMSPDFSWQGFLYPLFLAGLYSLSGSSLLAARIIQALMGALTVVLSFLLGNRIAGRKTGIAAGIITAMAAPLIFFDTQILATGLASLAGVSLVYFALEKKDEVSIVSCIYIGICAGLSILLRGTFIPFVAILLIWIVTRSNCKLLKGAILVAGVTAVLLPVAVVSKMQSGYFSAIPRAGSLNMYIGNNPESDRIVNIRPGNEWRNLVNMPASFGHNTEKEYRRFFSNRVKEYAITQPLSFASGIGRKTVQFVSSREIPRNYDLYTARRFSSLFSILVWKAGGFGFPFGLLFPLALLGLYWGRRNIPVPVWLFLILYSGSIILVFISSRYRAPILPVLSVPAAMGLLSVISCFSSRDFGRISKISVVIIVVVVVSTLPGPFAAEKLNYAAELYSCVGYELSREKKFAEAADRLETALDIEPGFKAAHRILGCVLHEQGRNDKALEHFEKALSLDPDSYIVHYYMGTTLLNLGETEKATVHLKNALEGALSARDEMVAYQARAILEGSR
jgi:hypothetical protein